MSRVSRSLQIKNGDRGLGDMRRDWVVVVAPEARLPAENEGDLR